MRTPDPNIRDRALELRGAHPYMSTGSALRLARYELTAPTMEDGASWQQDGFTMRVTVRPDQSESLADDILFCETPTADTIPNPSYRKDSRRPGSEYRYAETPNNSRSARYRFYRAAGASRAVAYELADSEMREDIERATWDYGVSYYVVTVTASRGGIELGAASLHGIDFGDDYGAESRYTHEIAQELASDAVDTARANVKRIVDADH